MLFIFNNAQQMKFIFFFDGPWFGWTNNIRHIDRITTANILLVLHRYRSAKLLPPLFNENQYICLFVMSPLE